MNFEIALADEGIAQHIEAQLLKDLRQHLPQAENTYLTYSATDNSGEILGGVTVSTAYSWLLIKVLWVQEDHRRSGLGKALIYRAESAGENVGCHSAWLDTSNPGAKLFYDKLGYTVFGELNNSVLQAPTSHTRWFMMKNLLSVVPHATVDGE